MLIDFDHSVGILDSSGTNLWMELDYCPYNEGKPSEVKAKRKNPTSASNKTRKSTCKTRTVETTTLVEDGYGWRKYGQKNIQHKLHPRSYYRCTHLEDEKCQAKKWVQQVSENPPIFRITYQGHHTCKNPLKVPHIFLPHALSFSYSSPSDNNILIECGDHYYSSKPFLLCFESSNPSHKYSNVTSENITQMGSASLLSSSSSSSLSSSSSSSSSLADSPMLLDEPMITMSSMSMESMQERYETTFENDGSSIDIATKTYSFHSMPSPISLDIDSSCDFYNMVDGWLDLDHHPF